MDLVRSKEFFEIIDAEYPDISQVRMAEIIGVAPKAIYNKRKQEWVTEIVADNWLTVLGLNHLLSGGELKIHEFDHWGRGGVPIKEARSPDWVAKESNQDPTLRFWNQRYIKMKKSREYWKTRALKAEFGQKLEPNKQDTLTILV